MITGFKAQLKPGRLAAIPQWGCPLSCALSFEKNWIPACETV